MTRKRARYIIGALLALTVLVVAGVRYLSLMSDGDASVSAAADAKAVRYHCPMHPTMVSDRPGDCPICGMRLVPIEEAEDEAGGAEGTHGPDLAPKEGHATEHGSQPAEHGQHAAAPAGKKKIIYRSTMSPNETSDRPGKDSMGMDMVREEIEEPPAGGSTTVDGRVSVKVSTQKRQLIGVRTAPVTKGPFTRTIRTVGRVTYDETRLRSVTTKISGWVERLYANNTGQLVKRGEPLLSIYSPELVASGQEYLLALRARKRLANSELAGESGQGLVASARRRLLLFDVTPQQIGALEETGEVSRAITLQAPIDGHIITRNVTQGDRIEPGTKLLDIAELSRVWVLADIYEYELPFIQLGQAATMTLSYLPGRTFEGRISLIYPVVSEATRTAKVRLEFLNTDFTLKPEMYAQVEIRSELGEKLTIPESAVISTGSRDIAFVDRGEGYFEPRELKLGIRLPDRFEVIEGLAAGEPVLISGNFLVDSESKLKAALAAAGADKVGGSSGHSH